MRPSPLRPGHSVAQVARAGFTLIEMMAVVIFTVIVVTAAANIYLDMLRYTERAIAQTQQTRRAVLLLDRVARDLESAMLVKKPPEEDPINHPWLFLAEQRLSDLGADRVKFMRSGHIPRSNAEHESDVEVVAYFLRESEDGESFDLLRWSSPRLPEERDDKFPRDDDEGAALLSDGIADFGILFVNEDDEEKSEWDSSNLSDSSELPIAAKIQVVFYPPGDGEEVDLEADTLERWVVMPVRPLDLETLFEPEEDDEDDEECTTGISIGECLDRNPDILEGLPQHVQDIRTRPNDCWSDVASLVEESGGAAADCE